MGELEIPCNVVPIAIGKRVQALLEQMQFLLYRSQDVVHTSLKTLNIAVLLGLQSMHVLRESVQPPVEERIKNALACRRGV